MPLSPGDVVAGKYRIEHTLGEGGMGTVYVATHGVLRKQVALKVMVERFRVSPDAVERFFREAVAASKVDHPAIAQVFDAGVHEDSPFIAMELLTGEDLDQRLRRGNLGVEEALQIVRPILSALDAAHRAGVVHRDIKPPNIFLARRPNGVITPKLLDFGIAKHMGDPNFDQLTQKGSVIGSFLYLSPEQAQSDTTVDHRADIYAIGVTLFHCLSGMTPYEASSFPELIGKMFSEPPRTLSELAPHVPSGLSMWIQRCLARDPEHRPQSAKALLDGLNSVVLGDGHAHAHTPEAFAKTQVPAAVEPSPTPVTPPTRHFPIPTEQVSTRPAAAAPTPTARAIARPEASERLPRHHARRGVGPLVILGVGSTIALVGLLAWILVGVARSGSAEQPAVFAPVTHAPQVVSVDVGAPMQPSVATSALAIGEGQAQLVVEGLEGQVLVDERSFGRAPVTAWVPAGRHVVSVQTATGLYTGAFTLEAGDHLIVGADALTAAEAE